MSRDRESHLIKCIPHLSEKSAFRIAIAIARVEYHAWYRVLLFVFRHRDV